MFDQQKVLQDAFNMSKNYWTTTMDMVTNFQSQNEKMWNTLIEQGLVSQTQGQNMLREWLTRSKQAREQFAATMQDNWKKAESAFSGTKSTK